MTQQERKQKLREVRAKLRDKELQQLSSDEEPSPKRSRPPRVTAVKQKAPPVLPFSHGGKGKGRGKSSVKSSQGSQSTSQALSQGTLSLPGLPSSLDISQDEPHGHYFGQVC